MTGRTSRQQRIAGLLADFGTPAPASVFPGTLMILLGPTLLVLDRPDPTA
jgi:hypothetical protein